MMWPEKLAGTLELNFGSAFKARLVVDDMIRECDDHGVANMLREIRIVLGQKVEAERRKDLEMAESQEKHYPAAGPPLQHPHYWRG